MPGGTVGARMDRTQHTVVQQGSTHASGVEAAVAAAERLVVRGVKTTRGTKEMGKWLVRRPGSVSMVTVLLPVPVESGSVMMTCSILQRTTVSVRCHDILLFYN